tara:strand:- start:23281 stop:23703 length:423 start_codon:yes stop_codon:yes gene_type:complete
MSMTSTVKEYYAALERLKQNKPQVIGNGSAINKDTVALEAGRKRGSIRDRPGFEQLIEDINKASVQPKAKRRTPVEVNKNLYNEVAQLQRDLDIARGRYMSLLHLNFEMAKRIEKLGGEIPKFGGVTNIEVASSSSDVPY